MILTQSQVTIELRGGGLDCPVGASAAQNIGRDPNVSLFWPPTDPGGYALINGAAEGERPPTGVTMARSHSQIHAASPWAQAAR